MKCFAQTVFEHIRGQIEANRSGTARGEKFLFIMPSIPLNAFAHLGLSVADYCAQEAAFAEPVIRVADALAQEWEQAQEPASHECLQTVKSRGWVDERGNLTSYRNELPSGGKALVVLLVGVDRVTDSSSLADFHHCDARTVWDAELQRSFARWVRGRLEKAHVAFDEQTLAHFDEVLVPIVNRGLADILQVSQLLDNLEFTSVQDGRDAEVLLLRSLGDFGLPSFIGYRFAGGRSFGPYLDDAIAFFSYDMFMEERARDRALTTADKFVEHNPLGQVFDAAERVPFPTDDAFIEALKRYIALSDSDARQGLLTCDFVVIRDKILSFRPPKEPRLKKDTVRRMSGGPIEVVLGAIWKTLGEFKKIAGERGVFAHEALVEIAIESRLFKHDGDGGSADERRQQALAYLSRLLGGVDKWLADWLGTARLGVDGHEVRVKSALVRPDLECQPSRTGEPYLQFSISVSGEGFETPIVGQFAWRLPEVEPYRVADELLQWASKGMTAADGYCLPAFHVPYYEELLLAKDQEETHRVLQQCIQDEEQHITNLLSCRDIDKDDPLLPRVRNLAAVYGRFIQEARTQGLHAALLSDWDGLRKAYEQACDGYLCEAACAQSPLSALLFRACLIVRQRGDADGTRWIWERFESSAAVTVLHPALLEMLQAHVVYLLTAFATLARKALRAPGTQSFRDAIWQSYVDLATMQMPLTGIVRDRNKVLDTSVRGENLIHRLGTVGNTEASLTTRLLLRYDAFDDEDITDAELFRTTRESTLLCRVLKDYRCLHPHADDGLSIAVYQNQDIQPVIAAVDQYLEEVCRERDTSGPKYQMSVTVFTESSDDSSVSRWISQWQERWESAETDGSLAHYRASRLSVAHRIVSSADNYRQFVELVRDSLEVDIAVLVGFVGAGAEGNDFERVDPFDVTTRTLKFPVLEKAFCSISAPGQRLQRARVLSNRQFRLSTRHTEIMARMKNSATPQGVSHVVLGFGDYAPWQGVVDMLHQRAEWVVCVDPNVDERLITEKGQDAGQAREIIGFGSGVGSHGESNYTISTEQFHLSDILQRLTAAIADVYTGWSATTYHDVAKAVLAEARRLSGLSLVRATGIGQYIRDFMAYSLTRKILKGSSSALCDQLVSLDAYRHWFDSAESDTRPDLLWLVADIGSDGRLHLDMRLIECKMAKCAEGHTEKAQQQLENGLRHLMDVFRPRFDVAGAEDERPDQRYWWLQLHRLIASKAQIGSQDQSRMLAALERLVEGDYAIEWRAAAITFWTDQTSAELKVTEEWPYSIFGHELGIAVVSAGSECVRAVCTGDTVHSLPWSASYVRFEPALAIVPAEQKVETGGDSEGGIGVVGTPPKPKDGGAGVQRRDETAVERADQAAVVQTSVPPRILLGKTLQGNRSVYWEFGHEELSNRHILIFGTSGMGKTYAIQCLLCEMAGAGQNSLIIDYTNGFLPNQLEEHTRQVLSPLQHVIRQAPLPINPFRVQTADLGGIVIPESHSSAAKRIAAIFQVVYALGEQQFSVLFDAIVAGLKEHGESMSLDWLMEILAQFATDDSKNKGPAQSTASKIKPFVLDNPFQPAADGLDWQALFADATNRCHVFQLAGLDMHSWKLVTEFVLWDLYGFLQSKGRKEAAKVVVLDEVQNLDQRDGSPLSKYLREGRKFGLSLVMATQIMSSLERDERDRMFNAAHKLFFRPADTEMRAYAEIAAITTGERVDTWVKRLSGLKKGECYSLGPSLNEAAGKLELKAFHIKVTSLEERVIHARGK